MTALFRITLAAGLAGGIAGCASPPAVPASAVVERPRMNIIAAGQVKDAVAIGRSTRADVVAALGEALVIRFDTGYEVWVYRLAKDARAQGATARRAAPPVPDGAKPDTDAEFVILFAPSGLVAKTRIRPAPPG
jgi:hypothetical protein